MRNRAGFTLLEVMIALAITAIVCGIVYASFYSVTESTVHARLAAEQTKLKQFVSRSLRANLDQVAQGWLPGAADRVQANEDEDVSAITFGFVGEDERGSAGPADSLEFVTMAPLAGAVVLPGMLKRVNYAVVEDDGGEPDHVLGSYDPDDPPAAFLEVTETPVFAMAAGEKGKQDHMAERAIEGESISWLLPIRSLDIRYFDGEEWADKWDGDDEERLPWAVDVRINFASQDSRDDEDRFLFEDDRDDGPGAAADLQFLATLPAGSGNTEPPPLYDAQSLPGRRGAGPGNGQ